MGNMMALAKQQAQAALALSNGRDVEAVSAIALGLAGDSPQATRSANDLAKRFPEDTIVQFEYLTMIHAAAALPSNAGKAVESLVPAARYELGSPAQILALALYPVYLRGEACVAAHQGSAAVSEFQKILAHPGVVQNEPIGALAHLGLGRAYAVAGDTAKARTAYQDFFALWKDADPNIPILKEAKAEYTAATGNSCQLTPVTSPLPETTSSLIPGAPTARPIRGVHWCAPCGDLSGSWERIPSLSSGRTCKGMSPVAKAE